MTRLANHALVKFDAGGLLLDLQSGGLFQLNESATFVWERWLAEMTLPEIASALAETYSIAAEMAEEHVAAALATKTIGPPPPTEFVYERSANRYIFSRGDQPILAIDERDGSIALAGPQNDKADLRNVLLAVAPKLLALRGHYVLHASAVILDGEVSAFCGESGAGKTTTARALAHAGAPLVCEDKLVVRTRGERVEAVPGIEMELLRWSQAAAESLAIGAGTFCPDLDRVNRERPLVVRELGLIDAMRRAGEEVVAIPLTPLAGASGIFRNAFYGSDVSHDWERQLKWASEIAHRIVTYDLTMPAGTARLAAAVAAVVRRGSLRSR
jgi:hypothetical protein